MSLSVPLGILYQLFSVLRDKEQQVRGGFCLWVALGLLLATLHKRSFLEGLQIRINGVGHEHRE